MRTHQLAVVAGDGIGPEVVGATRQVLESAATRFGFVLKIDDVEVTAQRYLRTGELWTPELADRLRASDAILFGALGDPTVPPGVLERGLILAMRIGFQQAVNLRPVRLYPGVESPVRSIDANHCDLVIVRENTEGAYVGKGSTLHPGTPHTVAVQESVSTRHGISRVVDFSFRLAQQRDKKLTLCHKKNILVEAGALWQEVVDDLGPQYPDVEVGYVHVDAMCYHLPATPERFDVVVTDNLFGDIITDLGAFIQGGMGVAASANLNLDGSAPSMFEGIHGSAPDIAGRGCANPIASILSGALCLATLGEPAAATAVESAVSRVLTSLPQLSGPQMGASTTEIGEHVADLVAGDASPQTGLAQGELFDQLAAVRKQLIT